MADKLNVENCPTCGHPCLIASSDEGTSYYAPIGWEDERRAYREILEKLVDFVSIAFHHDEDIHLLNNKARFVLLDHSREEELL
jgi:ssDNA-binding Zn-finger/Zn-ribbon topoisomerase 1